MLPSSVSGPSSTRVASAVAFNGSVFPSISSLAWSDTMKTGESTSECLEYWVCALVNRQSLTSVDHESNVKKLRLPFKIAYDVKRLQMKS